MKQPRTADPYGDLDVIDANAPRFNQAVIGSLALVAFLTGWWPLLAILAAQLAIGLTLGRRWCLPCVAYFELVQPRVGEGPVEDSRPPRFANKVGVGFLGAASIALVLGYDVIGWTLGLLVAGLALAAAATGICAGCEIYKLLARVRGIELCATCVGGTALLGRNDRQGRGYSPLPAALVDHVDAVVLPVGARDAEEDREPADRPEPPLLGERLVEAKLAPAHLVVAPGRLEDAVHEHLERLLHRRRKGHDPGFIHWG